MFRTHNKDCKPPPIIITANTCGIASEVCYQCQNCAHQWKTKQETFNWKGKNVRKGSNASYVMNVQYCLVLQQIGGARAEAGVVSNFLNLPYGTTM